jgi:hypothetical protein
VALGGGSGAAPANSGEDGGALGRVGARGGVYAHLGLVCARSWSGGATDGGARRCQAAAAAVVVSAPARGAHGLANKWALGLECEVGKVLGVSAGDERARGPELALGGGHGGWHGHGVCEGGVRPLNRGAACR